MHLEQKIDTRHDQLIFVREKNRYLSIDIFVAHLVYKILVKFYPLRSGQNWIQLDINLVDHSN